jgi:serine/threonine-protein kinase
MRYRLIERIGSGGMAEVFRAVAEGPHGFARAVVVKRILPRLAATPEFVQMFIDEAKISARLSHPNIVQTFAFAEPAGMPVMVMEHVEGRDLGSILTRLSEEGQAIPPRVVAEIARQCCAALDYAHLLTGADGAPLGIVHRDVTPSNIMISSDGVVKLLDFGIARATPAIREGDTAVGTMKGKMGYVAPEQITKGTSDARADLFALGAVMHEALTGRRVFAGASDVATLMNVLEKTIEPPSSVNPTVGEKLDWIVLRALRRDPNQRFASAAHLWRALDDYLGGGEPAGAPGRELREFMREIAPLYRRPPPPPGAPRGRRGDGDTLALEDAEILALANVDDRAPPAPEARPRSPGRRRRLLVAAAVTAVLSVLVGRGLNMNVPTGAAAVVARGDARGDRVQIVLDSSPQGALVAREPEGAPIGETPLLLELPRGHAPVPIWLRKPGYEGLVYKLIPSTSQPALVRLKRIDHGRTTALDATDPE